MAPLTLRVHSEWLCFGLCCAVIGCVLTYTVCVQIVADYVRELRRELEKGVLSVTGMRPPTPLTSGGPPPGSGKERSGGSKEGEGGSLEQRQLAALRTELEQERAKVKEVGAKRQHPPSLLSLSLSLPQGA